MEVVDAQVEKTEAVTEAMALAADKYSSLIVYLRMIYKDKAESKLARFGYKRWRRARHKQKELKELLELAYSRANSVTYKDDLIAKGFVQTDIDELNTLAQQLETTSTRS
jgi:hypothetical protein